MQISIRELKANPREAMAQAQQGQQGQRVQITSHRKVVAELVMPQAEAASVLRSADDQALARLLASGWVSQPATQPLALPKAVRFAPSPDGKTLSDLVIEGRGVTGAALVFCCFDHQLNAAATAIGLPVFSAD